MNAGDADIPQRSELLEAVLAQSRCETFVSNPIQGVRASVSWFVQPGWRGELLLGDKQNRV